MEESSSDSRPEIVESENDLTFEEDMASMEDDIDEAPVDSTNPKTEDSAHEDIVEGDGASLSAAVSRSKEETPDGAISSSENKIDAAQPTPETTDQISAEVEESHAVDPDSKDSDSEDSDSKGAVLSVEDEQLKSERDSEVEVSSDESDISGNASSETSDEEALKDIQEPEVDDPSSKLAEKIRNDIEEARLAAIADVEKGEVSENIPVENEKLEVDIDSKAAGRGESNHLTNAIDSEGLGEPRIPDEKEDSIAKKPAEQEIQPIVLANDGLESTTSETTGIGNVEIADELDSAEASIEGSEETIDDRPQTSPNIGSEDTGGSSKRKLTSLDQGTVLNGRYEIVRKIGGGGMGAVYLATDRNLGGVLRAVKEMVQTHIEEEQQEKAISDFKRESMLLTTLEHPSIPTIYDYFFDEQESRFYLVMKYISGGDLSGKLRAASEGRLEEKDVVRWGIQISEVLDYLHKHDPPIVYRDLKPANIMVDEKSGRAMLIDFGIARWVNKEEKGVTAVGTMGYAPPELFSGNVEPRSDIYSLGSTMFHLMTGADPQSNPLLIFDFQKNPRPRQINSVLSDQIEQILMRCVEYSASGRFTSAGEICSVLKTHLDKLETGNVSFGVKESPKAVGLSDQPVFCGFCGQKIVATDMFCAFCGAKQPLAQPGVQVPKQIDARVTAKLIIDGTSELDVPAFSLEKDNNLVGRRDPMSNIFPEVDLSKFDPETKISRRHARIWRDGGSYLVEDLGSSNGTVLISVSSDMVKLVPHKSHVLTNGDKIRLGDTMLHFVI